MFFACGIWCVADVSSVSPLLEQKNNKQSNYTYSGRTVHCYI